MIISVPLLQTGRQYHPHDVAPSTVGLAFDELRLLFPLCRRLFHTHVQEQTSNEVACGVFAIFGKAFGFHFER